MTTFRSVVRRFAPVVLLLATACGDQDESAGTVETDGPPESGGTAIVVVGADMTLPLAILAQGTLDGNLGGDVMFMELVRGDWDDGRLVFLTADESPMAIARSYEYIGADSASMRFHMRSGLRWSDGTPLTADDVVYTYSILGDPGLASPLQHYVEFLEDVEAENDSTVVFHFERRYPEMLTHTAVPIIPRHVFGETAPGEIANHPQLQDPANGNLPVSGPYMVGSWERGQRIVLVRNPHFEPAGHLDRIIFRIIPDPTTRIIELQNGTVDFVGGITFDQVPRLREQAPHVKFELEEKRFYDYVGYNGTTFAPFADPEIRRAMGLALDVPEMIAALEMDEFAVPAGGPYPPIFQDLYDPAGQAPLAYDTAAARQILDEKGWHDTDGDGILDRNGMAFSFTLLTNSGNQRRADVAQIAQQQWRRLGIDAQIQIREFNSLQQNLTAGDFQAILAGWSVGLSPDLSALWLPESPFNYTRYNNPELVSLIERALVQPTYEASIPAWREAATRIVQDRPYTWLYYMDAVDGLNERLRGTVVDTYGPYQNVWEWWIPAAERREGETLQ